MYNIPEGEDVFRYIVLKLFSSNPFYVYADSQYPIQKAHIDKGNCEQLNKQLASPGSNPIYKAHTENKSSPGSNPIHKAHTEKQLNKQQIVSHGYRQQYFSD